MTGSDIADVTVVGAGTMGHGIAEVAAMSGYGVTLQDVDADALSEGYDAVSDSLEKLAADGHLEEPPEDVLARLETETDLSAAAAGADLVVEAVPEVADLKRQVFADADEAAPEGAILATNTSSLSVTEIAEATDRPERVVGTHFFNPPVKMDLVEVVHGDETAEETADTAVAFAESLGKTPIVVRKDVFGFVVNNVLHQFLDEPAWMVSRDVATVREADAAMVHRRGYPMGPFELADLAGLDVSHGVREAGDVPVPPVMAEKVERGEYGRKTGEGYYDYEDGDGADYEPGDGAAFDVLRVEACMANAAARLVGDDVATAEEVDTGVRLGAGFPEGVCERADAVGLGTVRRVLASLYEETGDERYRPAPYLLDLVETGKTGVAAGAGFFDYDDGGGAGGDDAVDGDDRGGTGGVRPSEAYDELNYDLTGDGLLAVELDRPEEMNALSGGIRAELDDLLSTVPVEDVRCVTVEGAGDQAFCAGADIGRFGERNPTDWMDVTPILETVRDYERPTVAKIQGYCLGAGLELALACDLRIATADSRFGAPEINLGLIPGGGGTQRLQRVLGETRAKELVFRGNYVDGDRAADWGLVNRAVSDDEFESVVEEFVSDLLSGPPVALEVAKTVMNEGPDASIDAALTMESQGFGLLMGTEDVGEGIDAFEAGRDPDFEGR